METADASRSTRRRFLRDGAVAVGAAVLVDALATRSRVSAAPVTTTGDGVSMIGDSLTYGSLPHQADDFAAVGWPASSIDAHGSRGVRTKLTSDPHTGLTAVDAIRAAHGDTAAWVVALGTNDAGIYSARRYGEVIGTMLDRIGSGHEVVWVNIYLPRASARQTAWNAALTTAAAGRPGELSICDWAALAAAQPTWLAGDHVHCSASGYRQRSTIIADATVALLDRATSGLQGGGNGPPRSHPPVTHVQRF